MTIETNALPIEPGTVIDVLTEPTPLLAKERFARLTDDGTGRVWLSFSDGLSWPDSALEPFISWSIVSTPVKHE